MHLNSLSLSLFFFFFLYILETLPRQLLELYFFTERILSNGIKTGHMDSGLVNKEDSLQSERFRF